MSVVDNEGDLSSVSVTFQGAVNNNNEVMLPMARE